MIERLTAWVDHAVSWVRARFLKATSNGFEDTVYALDVVGSSLFAGGDFTEDKGAASSANYLAKLDVANGALDSNFTPSGPTTNAPVYLLRGASPLVLVGGQFFGCKSGTCGTNAFRLNASTGQPE